MPRYNDTEVPIVKLLQGNMPLLGHGLIDGRLDVCYHLMKRMRNMQL